MKIEKWTDTTTDVQILHDGRKAVILNEPLNTSTNPAKELLKTEGQPLQTVRQEAKKKEAEEKLDLSNYQFKQHLVQRGMTNEAKISEQVDITPYKASPKKVLNELEFIGMSMLEGFLEFVGIKLDGVVDRYESKLHVIETEDVQTGASQVRISKLTKDGDLINVSPDLKHLELAKQRLEEFDRKQQEREKSNKQGMALEEKKVWDESD
ncbi:hypothetical protein [Listeria booriae]|uniref:hypothetical protein n=1 Tax=Listeria booriae TaxID=1552123 RepID=UPI001625536B|nr:hypothetical protein [Listeria booriae]MBC1248121.1 hypothetical protein [Listeria booriae]